MMNLFSFEDWLNDLIELLNCGFAAVIVTDSFDHDSSNPNEGEG